MRKVWKGSAWVVLILGVAGAEYVWMRAPTERRVGGEAPSAETNVPHTALILPDFGLTPPTVLARWDEPENQARGEGWLFDVFTPPTLYRDPVTWEWSLTPPQPPDKDPDQSASTEAPAFAIEVLAIAREPFPVQLVGFGQQEGAGAFGVFENAFSGETLLGRQGGTLSGMNYEVERLEVVRMEVGSPEGGTYPVMAANAVVLEKTTGAKRELSSLARTYVGEAWIHYRTPDGPQPAAAECFATIREGGANYRVEAIDLEEPAVEVVKEPVAGGESQSRRFSVPVIAVPRPVSSSALPAIDAAVPSGSATLNSLFFP